MSSPHQVDLLVIGSGASGMTTAARAAQGGARVRVVEKAARTGGSAAISGGFVWTAADADALIAEDPGADKALVAALVEGFPESLDWLRSLELTLSQEIRGIYGFGYGHRIDPNAYLDRCRSLVESAGGDVVADAHVRSLRRDGERVLGADISVAGSDELQIDAAVTVLATGGFQASAPLRAQHIHPGAGRALVRSNTDSTGDGLQLGLEAGAETTTDMMGFYGHLVPSPLEQFPSEMFIPFAQLHSAYCLLVDRSGRRFTDESLGDHKNVQAVVRHPELKAILVADGEIHRTRVLAEYIKGLPSIDRLQVAADAGARYARADSLAELADLVGGWGVDAARFLRTVTDYNDAAGDDPSRLDPPRDRTLGAAGDAAVLRARSAVRHHVHVRRPARRCRRPRTGRRRASFRLAGCRYRCRRRVPPRLRGRTRARPRLRHESGRDGDPGTDVLKHCRLQKEDE